MFRAIVVLWLIAPAAQGQILYQFQNSAQAGCPSDTVVWLNTNSGIYHFQGERWYGNTEDGAYVCRSDADANGDRATRNGE
jgi:hypothetical protein